MDLYVPVLAPMTKIKLFTYYDDDGFGALYTTKAVKLKGAHVYGYMECPGPALAE